MKTIKVISSKGNEYTFYRLPKYDINGNARYCVHFRDLLTAEEFKAIPVLKAYELAAQRVKGFARRYNCRAFGGGFVFHSIKTVFREAKVRISERYTKEKAFFLWYTRAEVT